MRSKQKTSPAEKFAAVRSIYAGEPIADVSKRYGVSRENLYQWRVLLERRVHLIFAHGATLNARKKLLERIQKLEEKLAESDPPNGEDDDTIGFFNQRAGD